MPEDQSVLILGGGFGGWYTARRLASILHPDAGITVIDRVDHMLYTPMLTEVGGGRVTPSAISVSPKMVPPRVKWINAEVVSIDSHARSATLSDGQTLQATHLVLALGSTTSYHGIQGARENSIAFKTLADAINAHSRLDDMVSLAKSTPPGERRKAALTLMVAGGGYTGVETMAALYGRLKKNASKNRLNPDEITAVLIEPTDRLMHEMPEALAAYSKQKLQSDGVRVLTGVGVSNVTKEQVTLTNGERYSPELLVWDTGIEPSPLIQNADLPRGKHHGVLVDATMRVKGLENVWAIGDCAEIPDIQKGNTYAATAQNAVREGIKAADNIALVMKGKQPRPFRYSMIGQLALISDHDAIASIFGIPLRGFLAWVMWWIIYTAKLPGMRNRLRIIRGLLW